MFAREHEKGRQKAEEYGQGGSDKPEYLADEHVFPIMLKLAERTSMAIAMVA
jgi:hypothetical protein